MKTIYYCIDNCSKQVSGKNKRCHSCDMKQRQANPKNHWNWKGGQEAIIAALPNCCDCSIKLHHKKLEVLLGKDYKFVGNGEFWIKHFNPDFINCNGQKKIVELYGDYWHNLPEYKARDKRRMKAYKEFSYQTLIVWEHELEDLITLKKRLDTFCAKNKQF